MIHGKILITIVHLRESSQMHRDWRNDIEGLANLRIAVPFP